MASRVLRNPRHRPDAGFSFSRPLDKLTGMDNTCAIDGFVPLATVRPQASAELGEIVRQAKADKTALYPVGGQTMMHLGSPPDVPGHAVDMRALSKIIDFPARDMTITVEAGITLAQLRDILAKENLRLPIDVPQADKATLGGTVAANVSGSRRYGFGTLRDYVIGISAVNDAGNEFKAGGRVVKNVAGYDICKLLVGSLGTLAIISQVTLKLRPRAEERALVSLPCPDADLAILLDKLHASRTRPVCLDLLNRQAADEVFSQASLANDLRSANSPLSPVLRGEGAGVRGETRGSLDPLTPAPLPLSTGGEGKTKDGANNKHSNEWTIVIGFEGNAIAVQWQVQQLIREIGGSMEARVGFTAEPLWQALTEWSLAPGANVSVKATMLPSAVASFCQKVAIEMDVFSLRAHAGNGIVVGQASNLTCAKAAALLSNWREYARAGKGSVVVTRCPPAWKQTLSVWGSAPPDAWLMREIKKKFDPGNLFNPGRFVDGI